MVWSNGESFRSSWGEKIASTWLNIQTIQLTVGLDLHKNFSVWSEATVTAFFWLENKIKNKKCKYMVEYTDNPVNPIGGLFHDGGIFRQSIEANKCVPVKPFPA